MKVPVSAADAPGTHRCMSGAHVRMLMRRHGWTIRALAAQFKLTHKRVRDVRDRGVQGDLLVGEWLYMITGQWPEWARTDQADPAE